MKIASLKRLNPEDYPDIPEPFHPLMANLNDILEEVIIALQGKLSFADNLAAEIRTIKATHAVETSLGLQRIKGTIVAAFVKPLLFDTFRYAIGMLRPGVVRFKILFDSAPTTEQDVLLILVGT